MTKNRATVAGVVLLIVLMAIAGGILYWDTHKKKIIRTEIEKAVEKKSRGLYIVHYDSLDLDEIRGHLSVSSLRLSYDSAKYEQLKSEKKAPYLLFNITIPQLRIEGVQTPRALVDKEISGRHLFIINPLIEILYTNSDSSSHRTLPDKEIYRQILGDLNLIKLDSVVITGAEIKTKNLNTGKTFVRFSNFSLSLLDVRVDSVSNDDTTRLLFAKEVNLDCEKFTCQSRTKLYNYRVESIAFRSATSHVNIKSFFMMPEFRENEVVKKFSRQIDRLDVSLHDIQFKNIDFYQLANEIISSDALLIGSAMFKVYRDRNMPEDTRNKIGTYPQQLLQKIPVDFNIKKAMVRNVNIQYKEKSRVTHQSGVVVFSNSSADISNITNRKAIIAKDNRMTLELKSSFLGNIPLYSKWTLYLGNSKGRFSVSGRGDEADARIFNSLSVPMGPVEFKSGMVHRLSFELQGNDNMVHGTIGLLYDKFKVTLLKKAEDSIHYEKRKVASLFANMKIEDSNPDDNEPVRVANIKVQRDMHRSMFYLVWKCLFEGVKEITNAKK